MDAILICGVANTRNEKFENMRYIVNCYDICLILISLWKEQRRERFLYEHRCERFD